mmetsp:Transcript_67038/g.106606  ORF Transcript_67038/g.106606 Transcript_67038/m.106606 type:complete len:240 (-) Transcript_67038:10-729(-)
MSPKNATLYQKETRKLCGNDLMKHGNRRHALYFNIKDAAINKKTYRYGKQDWPMNNGIPAVMQSKLLDKIRTQFGILFNGIVFNVYTSKHSHIWWHTDLQPGVGDIICTFSTGRTDHLQFRAMHKSVDRDLQKERSKSISPEPSLKAESKEESGSENEIVLNVPCHHGTLVIMGPGVNQFYQHRVDVATEQQLQEAVDAFGCIDRENTTMHFHFDESKRDYLLNLEQDSALSLILKHLT